MINRSPVFLAMLLVPLLSGCQSTRDYMLAQGYPPAFASGYADGCASGDSAAKALGAFRKNVTVYLADTQYATGWDDGFRQCQASAEADIERRLQPDSDRDRDWHHQVDQDMARAMSRSLKRS
ncbi:hypothetical protein F7R01_07790 [Pseudomonas argentinensis]|uniref:Lipoprotein n=1 Tax=Phytopseudomonas argentinensis TaxID=289370 RepID=A0A1I3JPI0_9GAMM|nr:hypothetical protein [Pseudomonas argentinensis]KAB0551090.1 hypothetical protein F7R01_07790 [Pseudomonas argentinensis]SFI62066.1 hypothetical protein SAMN05216602_1969 [Pseudomonas argentinensis]